MTSTKKFSAILTPLAHISFAKLLQDINIERAAHFRSCHYISLHEPD